METIVGDVNVPGGEEQGEPVVVSRNFQYLSGSGWANVVSWLTLWLRLQGQMLPKPQEGKRRIFMRRTKR